MLRTSFRRSTRTRVLRAAFLIVGVVLVIDLLTFLLTRRHQSHAQAPVPNVHGQKVYIASIHWNNERILRSHWNDAVVGLVKYFGPENVYVSVHESGSWDDSKGALRLLDNLLQELRVNRTITLDPTTHLDEIQKPPADAGWIDTSRGRKELRRIPYLSKLRNLSLEPLGRLAEEGVKFDKILFLNDVVFTVQSPRTSVGSSCKLTLLRRTILRLLSLLEMATMPQPARLTSQNRHPITIPLHCEMTLAMKP